MKVRFPFSILVSAVLLLACGGTEHTLVNRPVLEPAGTSCSYLWREDDGWAFLAWALDVEGGAAALALASGYDPMELPSPGDTVMMPLNPHLQSAMEARFQAARLVREATGALEERDTVAVRDLLTRAMDSDPGWSVPVYDLSLIVLRQEGPEKVLQLLRPVSHKYEAALLQSELAWNRGDTEEALDQLEICLMDQDPPFEVMAAAALIYTVMGKDYQASGIWRRILASPEADASIRLMAAEYALLQEERQRR